MKNFYVITFILTLSLSACGQDKTTDAVTSVNDTVAKNDTSTLSLLFIGDVMGHGSQIKSAYIDSTDSYNYDTCFSKIKHLFNQADYTIANLEVTLGVKPYKGYPQFSSPFALAKSLKKSGVDALVTSNNHTCDRGEYGVGNTIKLLDSINMSHTGSFYDSVHMDSTSPLIVNRNGIKVAIINFTYGTNGLYVKQPYLVNYIDSNTIDYHVNLAKTHNPDHIIAFVHWGTEYQNLPSTYQLKWEKYIYSKGVNIIVGSHPHVIQPMKWQKDSINPKNDKVVVYSLGNFVSNQRNHPTDGGAMFKLTLAKDTSTSFITNAEYYLTWVHTPVKNEKKDTKWFFILPASEYESDTTYFKADTVAQEKMKKYIKHARGLMEKENVNVKSHNGL